MILRALYDLARQESLADDLDYEWRGIRFILTIGRDGSSAVIQDLAQPQPSVGRGEPRLVSPPMKIPRQSGRTSGAKAEFLVDKAEYVFGWDPAEARSEYDLSERHHLFLAEIKNVLAALPPETDDAKALDAVRRFLSSPPATRVAPIRDLMTILGDAESAKRALSGALFVIMYEPLAPTPVHLLPRVEETWRNRRATRSSASMTICVVTGEICEPVKKHPPVKLVPGGNASGAALVSFNSAAFESYQAHGNDNAPVGRLAAEAYVTALNRLLARDPVNSRGEKLERRHVRLSNDTTALFWSRGESSLDWIIELAGDAPDTVRALLGSPRTGQPSPLSDASAFYTLVLSGAQGRSIIRSFLESTTQVIATNIRSYIDDLSIERPFKRGVGIFPLYVLLRGLAPLGDIRRLPPSLASDLYLSAVRGTPFPRSVLEAATRRNRSEGPTDRDGPQVSEVFVARCALIKASLIRQREAKEEPIVALDIENRNPAYLLGRMLAVLERVQQDALGSVNATLVDRYYGSASSTPAAVLPTLLRRTQHHFAKLRRDKPGLAVVRDRVLQEIASGINAFPKTMGLEAQGFFALGFLHQSQDFFRKQPDTTAEAV